MKRHAERRYLVEVNELQGKLQQIKELNGIVHVYSQTSRVYFNEEENAMYFALTSGKGINDAKKKK